MKISGLQKVSLVDYNEHICATIFTSGCNFKCPFCHNSGLVNGTEPELSQSEVLDYLEKRTSVLDSVCISGGEPTLNHDLPDFISKIKDLGYLVKLDTNGTNLEMLHFLVENKLIDYIAMDIKNSINKYSITAGKDVLVNIKDSIKYIMNCGLPYEFRTTLVEEYHNLNDMVEIGQLIQGANNYYLQKFQDGDNCIHPGLHPIPKSIATEFVSILSIYITKVHLRGY